jgi:hypothetical protein
MTLVAWCLVCGLNKLLQWLRARNTNRMRFQHFSTQVIVWYCKVQTTQTSAIYKLHFLRNNSITSVIPLNQLKLLPITGSIFRMVLVASLTESTT